MSWRFAGPGYRTTAADRNARMANRMRGSGIVAQQEGTSGQNFSERGTSSSPLEQRGDYFPERRASHVTFQDRCADTVAHSTGLEAAALVNRFEESACLMDLDNDVMEQVASLASDGAVHLNQSSNREPLPDDSSLSQYREVLVENNTRRGSLSYRPSRPSIQPVAIPSYRSAPRQPEMLSNVPVTEYNQSSLANRTIRPFNNSMEPTGLSKTDRMVILELLKNIPPVDGSNEVELVTFLKNLMPIFDIAPSGSLEIIKLIIPKVQGQLFRLFMEAVAVNAGWNTLHNEMLDRFIPPLRRREIVSFELDRPQQINETYVEYVEHLLSVAFALKTDLSEQEVIEIALNKCRPEIRPHFNFGCKPSNIQELRQLAYRVTSAVRADARYFGSGPPQGSSNRFFRSEAPRATFNRGNGRPHSSNDLRSRQGEKIVRCYRCNQEGHVARNCRAALN